MSTPEPVQAPVPRAAAVRELAGALLLLAGAAGLVAAAFVVHPALGLAVLSAAAIGAGVLLAAPRVPRGEV